MKTLKKDQLLEIREEIFAVIDKSSKTRANLLKNDELERRDFLKIAEKENELQEVANDLNRAFLKEVVDTDLKDPGNKIKIATDKVNAAVEKLKTVDEFTGILAKVFNIASKIVGAFSTGNFLQLADVLDHI